MKQAVIGIIGEYNPDRKTHPMLNGALDALKSNYDFEYEWLATPVAAEHGDAVLGKYSGIWSASGSPFLSIDGVYKAIRYARTNNVPHIGTCGGFQHTVLEFARNVLGLPDPQSEEFGAKGEMVIHKMRCTLRGLKMKVIIKPGTKAYACFGTDRSEEEYFCNYGINPEYRESLEKKGLVFSGVDHEGEIRIVELPHNDFFISTLFVPHARSAGEPPHPMIEEFIRACISRFRRE
ncbi:MAG: hypothetical protein A2Y33_11820 [Spirochaetes bacterium GWF1_51_8]|nr:MAG: hypothetical protein A2Y33_11820 [Spirochaetes bacterium GWF1_51_8]